MADRPRFRTVFYKLAPAWLTSDDGEKVFYSLGLIEDMWMERLRQGLNARFPTRATEEALGYIGQDRRIVKGYVEPAATYASRLLRWLDDWRTAGNAFALMKQVKAYSGVTKTRTVDQRGNWYTIDVSTESFLFNQLNWNWDGTPLTNWSRFWLIMYSVSAPWVRIYWGTGGVKWGDMDKTWGSTATLEEVKSIRGIVKDWKPAHAKCVNIIVSFSATSFGPGDAGSPDGTWGNWSKDSGGTQVTSRNSNGIYWDGP